MPILKRDFCPDTIRAGALVVQGVCDGHHPVEALWTAVAAFEDEFGREPKKEQCRITVFFTSHDTHCEIAEEVKEGPLIHVR